MFVVKVDVILCMDESFFLKVPVKIGLGILVVLPFKFVFDPKVQIVPDYLHLEQEEMEMLVEDRALYGTFNLLGTSSVVKLKEF